MTSDTAIMIGLVSFFIILGALIPIAQQEFNQDIQEFDSENLNNKLAAESSGISLVTQGITILLSILSMFVWNIAGLPVLVNIILLIPRFIFWYIVFRGARGI